MRLKKPVLPIDRKAPVSKDIAVIDDDKDVIAVAKKPIDITNAATFETLDDFKIVFYELNWSKCDLDKSYSYTLDELMSLECIICHKKVVELKNSTMEMSIVDHNRTKVGHSNCFSESKIEYHSSYVETLPMVDYSNWTGLAQAGDRIKRPYGEVLFTRSTEDLSLVRTGFFAVKFNTPNKNKPSKEVINYNRIVNEERKFNEDSGYFMGISTMTGALISVLNMLVIWLNSSSSIHWLSLIHFYSLVPFMIGLLVALGIFSTEKIIRTTKKPYRIEIGRHTHREDTSFMVPVFYWDLRRSEPYVHEITVPLIQQFESKVLYEKFDSFTPEDRILWKWTFELLMDCVETSRDTERADETIAWAKSFVDGFFTEVRASDWQQVISSLLELRNTLRSLPKTTVQPNEILPSDELKQIEMAPFEAKNKELQMFKDSLTSSNIVKNYS